MNEPSIIIQEDIVDKFNSVPSMDPDHCIYKIKYYSATGKTLYCSDCISQACIFKPLV